MSLVNSPTHDLSKTNKVVLVPQLKKIKIDKHAILIYSTVHFIFSPFPTIICLSVPFSVSHSHSTPLILLTQSFVRFYSTCWASYSQLEDAIEQAYWFFSSSVWLLHEHQMEKRQTHLRKRREGRANGKTGLVVCADKRRENNGEKVTCGFLYWSDEQENSGDLLFLGPWHSSFHSFALHALFIGLILLSVLLSSVFPSYNTPSVWN